MKWVFGELRLGSGPWEALSMPPLFETSEIFRLLMSCCHIDLVHRGEKEAALPLEPRELTSCSQTHWSGLVGQGEPSLHVCGRCPGSGAPLRCYETYSPKDSAFL